MPGRKIWRQRWREFIGFITEVYARFTEDRVPLAAGAISFFTLLSLFPLVLLALTIAAPLVQDALANLRGALGEAIYQQVNKQIISVVSNRGVSILVASVLGIWGGGQVFLILESAMNLAWHAQRKRPYWLRRVIAMAMILVVGTLLAGSIFLANLIRFLASLEIPLWGHSARDLPWLIPALVTIVVPTLLISALFAVVYRVLPSKRITVRTVIPGALFSGILWLISLHLFGWYMSHFALARYTVLYGTFGGIILLLLWFYYSASILLLGAEISAAYHRRLVRAGNLEERLVEENEQFFGEQVTEEARQSRQREAATVRAYYGYQSEE